MEVGGRGLRGKFLFKGIFLFKQIEFRESQGLHQIILMEESETYTCARTHADTRTYARTHTHARIHALTIHPPSQIYKQNCNQENRIAIKKHTQKHLEKTQNNNKKNRRIKTKQTNKQTKQKKQQQQKKKKKKEKKAIW